MKNVSQRSTLRTVAKPDELELQPSQPNVAGESGGRVVRGNTKDPPKVRGLRPLLCKAKIPKCYICPM